MSRTPMTFSALLLSSAVLAGTPAIAQTLEPATQVFIDSLAGSKPIYTLPLDEARSVLAGAQSAAKVSLAPAIVDDRVLKIGPTGETRLRVYRPVGVKGPLPVVIYSHGGGWVLGDKNTHERLLRELTDGAKVVSVFVDYERSPEARFPVAIEQIYATLDHVAKHPGEFNADPRRIALAGDSVGGNMSAAVALMAKERHGPKLAAQLLFYPVTDASMTSQSYTDFAEGPWLTRKAMEWFWDQYLPDASKRADVRVSPINAKVEQLRGLPQALVIVDENDVLRDEGEAYGRKLAAAGVTVTAARYNGTIHDFMLLNPIADTPATRQAVAQAIDYFKTVFAR